MEGYRDNAKRYKPLTSEEPNTAVNQTEMTPTFDGDWDTALATPVGKLEVMLSISTRHGMIHGTATQGDETIEFMNPVLQDDKPGWSLRITKPMRLNLKFEVVVIGNHMLV